MTLRARGDGPTRKPVVLIVTPHYLPGHRGGGPIRSLANLTDRLSDEYQFRIVAKGCDFGSGHPYPGVPLEEWTRVGSAEVYYLRPPAIRPKELMAAIRCAGHDLLYLQGVYSPRLCVLPILLSRWGVTPKRPVIVAPRGELMDGAVAHHPGRKRTFLALARATQLHRDVLWQATSEQEAAAVRRHTPPGAWVMVAPNLPSVPPEVAAPTSDKRPGFLRIVSISRIARSKNLSGAILSLRGLAGIVQMDVYGPLEDAVYWDECLKMIASLPPNIQVTYHGDLKPEEVSDTFATHHLFLFPTLTENFGHVVLEALGAGCPVLLSDRTPWNDLYQRQAGWVVPVKNTDVFTQILQECVYLDAAAYGVFVNGARAYARDWHDRPEPIAANRYLFECALSGYQVAIQSDITAAEGTDPQRSVCREGQVR